MCSQTRNSCAKAFNNRSRSKNLKPKNRGMGGGQFDPPPLEASRVNRLCLRNIIAGGDFNLVQDVNLDKQGGRDLQTHKEALQELDTIKLKLDLGDIWRDLNADKKRLTWRRRNPTIQCRLDFFLISNGLYSKVANADITPGYKTDN